MHKDFHLYGTFLAAVLAGYETEEAEQIAFAAQKVDDFGPERSKNCHTVTGMYEAPMKAFGQVYFTDQVGYAFDISDTWMPFHFVPRQEIGSDISNVSKAFACGYGQPMEKVCNAIVPQGGEQPSIERIGITMHVLADSYAHQEFSGITCYNPRIIEQIKVKYKTLSDGLSIGHVPVKILGLLSGIFYYGHGAAGHVPDLAWAEYSYCWKYDENITNGSRNNPMEFAKAFEKMVDVLLECRGETQPVETVGFGKEDISKWLADTAEQIQLKRSNIMKRNDAMTRAWSCVPWDIKAKQRWCTPLTDEEQEEMEEIRERTIVLSQYDEDGTERSSTVKVGRLLDECSQELNLEEGDDTTFAQFYAKYRQENWKDVDKLDQDYQKYLQEKKRDEDFECAAIQHKEEVYKAIKIAPDQILDILRQEYSKAFNPAEWVLERIGRIFN